MISNLDNERPHSDIDILLSVFNFLTVIATTVNLLQVMTFNINLYTAIAIITHAWILMCVSCRQVTLESQK